MQGNDIQDLNGEDTLLTASILAPGTQQMKLIYGMGLGTARIGQTYPITEKTLLCMEREVPLSELPRNWS